MSEKSGGSGKWCQPSVPHKGWTCVDVEDLGEPSETCEMCETQEIRYVHVMEHRDYPQGLRVGCVCAGHMEQDYERARRREKVMRSAAGRRARWLSRKWRTSRSGNPFINTDGYNVVVFPRTPDRTHWGFRIQNQLTQQTVSARQPCPSEDAAKLRALDAMIWLKERGR